MPSLIDRPARRWPRLQGAGPGLLALDRLEEGLEVALAEAARTLSLDDLEEERRPVGQRLAAHLQQVPAVVAVHEDRELLERVPGEVHAGHPLAGLRVV